MIDLFLWVLLERKGRKERRKGEREERKEKEKEGRRGKRMRVKQKRPRMHGTEHEVGREAGFPNHP